MKLYVWIGTIISMLPACASGNNGMYLPGYGNESVMMGGADVAIARDAFATVNNPSGMTQISGQALDIEIAPWFVPDGTHTDSFGNYRKPKTNSQGAYASGAYARRFENSPIAAGISLVVQGGVGWTYSGLNSIFGTRDDASAVFGIVKLAPAIAWEVNDSLSLGVALGINYLAGNQELFPNTSTPTFSGFRFKDASGIGLNSKWGLQYRPAKDVTIGVTYGTQTSVPMKNGTLRVNYTNIIPGLGIVRYDNAKLTGLRMPEELAIGISFRPVPSLLVSLQDKWYNWSEAINKLQLTAANPRNAAAPAIVVMPSTADWLDQHILAAGVAFDYDMKTTLVAGVNYGKNPVPSQNLSPIFSPIQVLHYMFGFSRKIDDEWQGAVSLEYYVPRKATYDSPLFGINATEVSNGMIFHLSMSRRW